MATFTYSMSKRDAVLAFKKQLLQQNMVIPILKEEDGRLVVGAAWVRVIVLFEDGICKTSATGMGKKFISTIDSIIELTEGFERQR